MRDLEESEMSRVIHATLDQLPERTRVMIQMHIMHGYRITDLAKKFGMSHEFPRQIIQKGLKQLRHPSRSNALREWLDFFNEPNDEPEELLPLPPIPDETGVEDRFDRIVKAQSVFKEWNSPKRAYSLRQKYGIPPSVYLFQHGTDCPLTTEQANECRRYLSAFIAGTLTRDAVMDLILYFSEYAECDYGWILVNCPLGFYGRPGGESSSVVCREICKVGTRSRRKENLPKLAMMF